MKFKKMFHEVANGVSVTLKAFIEIGKAYRKEIFILTLLGGIAGAYIGKTIATRLSVDFDVPTEDEEEEG